MTKDKAVGNKQHPLSEISGIGPASLIKLKAIGITTVEAFAYATRRELEEASIKESARKLQEQAFEMIGAKLFVTAEELRKTQKDVKKLSTGVTALDEIFQGGYETRSLTELVGEFGTGKSQLAYTASVMVQVPESEGGLNGAALLIDTEETFRVERIEQIAKARGVDPDLAVKRVIVAPAFNSDHQELILSKADDIIQEYNVRLIIVDSLIAHFRSEYRGRGELSERQQEINRHLHHIARLARGFNAVALITNQAVATPDNVYSHVQWKPAGGNIMAHAPQLRVALRKAQDPMRIARIIDSSFLPTAEAVFSLSDHGVSDITEEQTEKRKKPGSQSPTVEAP